MRGQVEIRVGVRSNHKVIGGAAGAEPAVLGYARRVAAKAVILERPDLDAAAEALASAIVRDLYSAGYL
jgi:hypothetical protein